MIKYFNIIYVLIYMIIYLSFIFFKINLINLNWINDLQWQRIVIKLKFIESNNRTAMDRSIVASLPCLTFPLSYSFFDYCHYYFHQSSWMKKYGNAAAGNSIR